MLDQCGRSSACACFGGRPHTNLNNFRGSVIFEGSHSARAVLDRGQLRDGGIA